MAIQLWRSRGVNPRVITSQNTATHLILQFFVAHFGTSLQSKETQTEGPDDPGQSVLLRIRASPTQDVYLSS
jgi:hypothetical protein